MKTLAFSALLLFAAASSAAESYLVIRFSVFTQTKLEAADGYRVDRQKGEVLNGLALEGWSVIDVLEDADGGTVVYLRRTE